MKTSTNASHEAISALSMLVYYIDSGCTIQGIGLASLYPDAKHWIEKLDRSKLINERWQSLRLVMTQQLIEADPLERRTVYHSQLSEASGIASELIEAIEHEYPVIDTLEALRDDARSRKDSSMAEIIGKETVTSFDISSAGLIKLRARRLGIELSSQLAVIETVNQYKNLMIEVESLCELKLYHKMKDELTPNGISVDTLFHHEITTRDHKDIIPTDPKGDAETTGTPSEIKNEDAVPRLGEDGEVASGDAANDTQQDAGDIYDLSYMQIALTKNSLMVDGEQYSTKPCLNRFLGQFFDSDGNLQTVNLNELRKHNDADGVGSRIEIDGSWAKQRQRDFNCEQETKRSPLHLSLSKHYGARLIKKQEEKKSS